MWRRIREPLKQVVHAFVVEGAGGIEGYVYYLSRPNESNHQDLIALDLVLEVHRDVEPVDADEQVQLTARFPEHVKATLDLAEEHVLVLEHDQRHENNDPESRFSFKEVTHCLIPVIVPTYMERA